MRSWPLLLTCTIAILGCGDHAAAPETAVCQADAAGVVDGASDAAAVDAPAADDPCARCGSTEVCVNRACVIAREPAFEAARELVRLRGLLVAYFDSHGHFPVGTAASTPAAACCSAGDQFECPPEPAAWTGIWAEIGFAITTTQPYTFSYGCSSTMTSALAIATGDLDCDGVASNLTLICEATNGVAGCELVLPQIVD